MSDTPLTNPAPLEPLVAEALDGESLSAATRTQILHTLWEIVHDPLG